MDDQLMTLLLQISINLDRIATALEQSSIPEKAPNYQRDLTEFPYFDWSTIGATVDKSDSYGAAVVTWRSHQYYRRSPTNNFSQAVWFSRCMGKDESGRNLYETLVKFKLSPKVKPVQFD